MGINKCLKPITTLMYTVIFSRVKDSVHTYSITLLLNKIVFKWTQSVIYFNTRLFRGRCDRKKTLWRGIILSDSPPCANIGISPTAISAFVCHCSRVIQISVLLLPLSHIQVSILFTFKFVWLVCKEYLKQHHMASLSVKYLLR